MASAPATAELKRRVVELRNQSLKWQDVAAQVDRSVSYCCELYYAALAEVPASEVAQARAEECQLVETALAHLLTLAQSPDDDVSPRTKVEAWNSARGWSEHRSRLLGLNAPTRSQVQVISEDAIDAEIERLSRELTAPSR